jgi:CubicO group peptidase (beta-lactamase class C family)
MALVRPAAAFFAIFYLLAWLTAARAEFVPADAIERIDVVVREGLDKKISSFAVAVVKDGRLVLARGYGYADLENSVPATAETVYRLGSITKQFTSMAVMQLAGQGKLSVDDELTKFLPDYPVAGHKVTVHQLLNHTSGIKSYTSLRGFFKTARQDLSHDEMLALFKDEPFDFEPGDKWKYNNSGYYLLGLVIEKASGQSYADYLTEHIFRPLGMHATRYDGLRPLIPHRAQGYKRARGEIVLDEPISMTAPFAAGALVSNVLDLVKWHQALEAGDFLTSASYDAMYRPTTLRDGRVENYAYGWGTGALVGHRKLSHGGGINGFSTQIARYPHDRLAVIVLSNTAAAPVGRVEARISKLMLGIDDPPIVDVPADESLLRPLVGGYELMEGKVQITIEEGKLHAQLPGRSREPLKYQGEYRFVSGSNEDVRFTFRLVDGKVAGLDLEIDGQTLTAKRIDPSAN